MRPFTVESDSGPIAATHYEPTAPRHTLVLAHGAGAGQAHPWMRGRAADLADRGVRVITFDFPYITARRKVPDRAPVLLATWRAVIRAVEAEGLAVGGRVAIGGKSMGGRMATMLAAEPDVPPCVVGCVALGYPLHPPGKPEQLRVEHLGRIRVPLLVIQGDRDPFGGSADIADAFDNAGARPRVVAVPHGGHGFEVRVRDGRQTDVYARVADEVAGWLDTLQAS